MAVGCGCEVFTADSVPAATALIQQRSLDLVLLDLRLPGGNGASLLQLIKEKQPRASVVVMTAYATVHSAVDLMRNGAFDLLQKPFGIEQITAVLERVRHQRQRSAPSRALQDRLAAGAGNGRMVADSPAMEKVFRIVAKVAQTRHPVLIQGESGTGKEMVARVVHSSGPEPAAPFVPVDCDSLAPELLDRELFGADAAHGGRVKPGVLVAAARGTVYLDEIASLSPSLQVKLLRALQDKLAVPAGGVGGVRFESRVLVSSSRDLQAMVDTGRFRKDLYYRLNIVNLRIPPLRERQGDVSLLAAYFLERQRRELDVPFVLSDDALNWMEAYHWAGNVRELESVIDRACALSSGPLLHLADLSTQIQAYAQAAAGMQEPALPVAPAAIETIEESEKRTILRALQLFHPDKIAAAKALGIGKTTLYRKLKEYGIGDEEL